MYFCNFLCWIEVDLVLQILWKFFKASKEEFKSSKIRFSKRTSQKNETSSGIEKNQKKIQEETIKEINFGTVKKLLFFWVCKKKMPFCFRCIY
jgi:hypothetical protein